MPPKTPRPSYAPVYRKHFRLALSAAEASELLQAANFRARIKTCLDEHGLEGNVDKVTALPEEIVAWAHCTRHSDGVAGFHMAWKFTVFYEIDLEGSPDEGEAQGGWAFVWSSCGSCNDSSESPCSAGPSGQCADLCIGSPLSSARAGACDVSLVSPFSAGRAASCADSCESPFSAGRAVAYLFPDEDCVKNLDEVYEALSHALLFHPHDSPQHTMDKDKLWSALSTHVPWAPDAGHPGPEPSRVSFRQQALADVEAVVSRVWGFPAFRGKQAEVIQHLLQGSDVLALLPTGSGKSLIFQAPAVRSVGTTIVIAPLLALLKDQVANLAKKAVGTDAYIGRAASATQRSVLDRLADSELRVFYVSPESIVGTSAKCLQLQDIIGSLWRAGKVDLVVFDECHCISEWGMDFRPAYRRLGILRQWWPGIPFLCLTATATQAVCRDVAATLSLHNPAFVSEPVIRRNLRLRVIDVAAVAHKETLANALCQREGLILVYCNTRADVDRVSKRLRDRGVASSAFHAGLKAPERDAVTAPASLVHCLC
jgi:hypothetical protein